MDHISTYNKRWNLKRYTALKTGYEFIDEKKDSLDQLTGTKPDSFARLSVRPAHASGVAQRGFYGYRL